MNTPAPHDIFVQIGPFGEVVSIAFVAVAAAMSIWACHHPDSTAYHYLLAFGVAFASLWAGWWLIATLP
jgi:hypothetical protein